MLVSSYKPRYPNIRILNIYSYSTVTVVSNKIASTYPYRYVLSCSGIYIILMEGMDRNLITVVCYSQ